MITDRRTLDRMLYDALNAQDALTSIITEVGEERTFAAKYYLLEKINKAMSCLEFLRSVCNE